MGRCSWPGIFLQGAIRHTRTGADPGFFLGGGALVSCSTSTPINHIFFFGWIPVVLENCRSSQGGGGVRTPCTHPLDPPLREMFHPAVVPQSHFIFVECYELCYLYYYSLILLTLLGQNLRFVCGQNGTRKGVWWYFESKTRHQDHLPRFQFWLVIVLKIWG